jgi:hypothetical protein
MHKNALIAATIEGIGRVSDALNQHAVQAAMAQMTVGCVFDSAYPLPDGGVKDKKLCASAGKRFSFIA